MSKGLHQDNARNDSEAKEGTQKVLWIHLSIPLKIAVVTAWILGVLYALIFVYGILQGATGQ